MSEFLAGLVDVGADWWQAIAAVIAVLVAVVALVHSHDANVRAKEALDFQKRVDARAAEFREVKWNGKHRREDEDGVFTLTNTGITDAHNVTVVIYSPMRRVIRWLPPIRRGETVNMPTGDWGEEREPGIRDGWKVHWTSPLGHAEVDEQEPYNEWFGAPKSPVT